MELLTVGYQRLHFLTGVVSVVDGTALSGGSIPVSGRLWPSPRRSGSSRRRWAAVLTATWAHSLSLLVPGLAGGLRSNWRVYVLFLPAVPLGLAGVLLLVTSTVRALRGQQVSPRDIVAATLLISILVVYVLALPAFAGPPV